MLLSTQMTKIIEASENIIILVTLPFVYVLMKI